MDFESYYTSLGTIISNLHSLEVLLRHHLYCSPDASGIKLPDGSDVYSLSVGDEVPVNDFTSYDPLRNLIRKFNESQDKNQHVDDTLVLLRDSLAHGRAMMKTPDSPMRVIKFSRPDKSTGKVNVEFNEILTNEWFNKAIKRTRDAIRTVRSANTNLKISD